MQQDWKTVWDNLNPDEAAKERMKQAILQKMYAEVQPKKTQKTRSPCSGCGLAHWHGQLHFVVQWSRLPSLVGSFRMGNSHLIFMRKSLTRQNSNPHL